MKGKTKTTFFRTQRLLASPPLCCLWFSDRQNSVSSSVQARKVAADTLCDIPMAQFIINLNASMPASQKFIIHILDSTHLFVQPHVAEMIRSAIAEFRDQNSYEKPA